MIPLLENHEAINYLLKKTMYKILHPIKQKICETDLKCVHCRDYFDKDDIVKLGQKRRPYCFRCAKRYIPRK